jgi:hypothetical protein
VLGRHEVEVARGLDPAEIGIRPWLIRWAVVMIRLDAA